MMHGPINIRFTCKQVACESNKVNRLSVTVRTINTLSWVAGHEGSSGEIKVREVNSNL